MGNFIPSNHLTTFKLIVKLKQTMSTDLSKTWPQATKFCFAVKCSGIREGDATLYIIDFNALAGFTEHLLIGHSIDFFRLI